MDLSAVMDEAALVLEGLSGLRVSAWPVGSVSPPAGIVSYPDGITYDETYGRGTDRIDQLTMTLVVGKVTERAARDLVAAYSAGDGELSVKAACEAHAWTSCDDLTVSRCEFDIVTIGAVQYLAATFYADVLGPALLEAP
jgi:hypothetical protein